MRRLAIRTLVLLTLATLAAATAGRSSGGSAVPASTWRAGVDAVLPANAATGTNRNVSLNSVSCASAGNCSAVGWYRTKSSGEEGLLVSEHGGRWAAGIEAGLPSNAATVKDQGVSLNSVSCASAGNCIAVGSYDDSSGGEGVLLAETAGKWRTGVEATLPATAVVTHQFASLNSVSCSSPGYCSVVGRYTDASGGQALLLTESAGTWGTGVEAALPANARQTDPVAGLGSVSCSSAGNCSAVGSYVDSSGNGPALLMTETRGTWGTGVEAVLPANAATTGQFVGLRSVSCASAGNCTAVGNYNTEISDDGVLLTETDGQWSPGVKALLPANGAPQDQIDLNDVSCPTSTGCAAVGDYVDRAGNIRSLVLNRTAGKWSRGLEVALPANAIRTAGNQLGGLNSVSCTSAGNCTAVGGYWTTGRAGDGLFVTEIHGGWTSGVEAVLRRNAPYGGYLTSVSCASAGHCSAAGGYQQAQGLLFSSSAKSTCLVPNVRGKTLPAARRAIETGRCSVGTIGYATSPKVKKGRVISQNPKPGERLNHGAKVDLVVSTGQSH